MSYTPTVNELKIIEYLLATAKEYDYRCTEVNNGSGFKPVTDDTLMSSILTGDYAHLIFTRKGNYPQVVHLTFGTPNGKIISNYSEPRTKRSDWGTVIKTVNKFMRE